MFGLLRRRNEESYEAAKRAVNDNLIERVRKLVPEDGDVIVLTVNGTMTFEVPK